MERVDGRGDYVDGSWVKPASPAEEIDQPSPADLADRVGAFPVSPAHVGMAVEAARRAQPAWERAGLEARCERLRAFGAALLRREAHLVRTIGREVGKPAWEARAEVQALGAKVAITLDEGLALVRGFSLEGGRLETRYRPHGVMAVLGPFNFPLHLAHGHVVPALATGNTVVLKPSEVAPACAQAYAEAAEEAGFPPGVFNLVQGRGAAGALLASHPDVDGVLFTGSYATGVNLLEANAHRPGRMLALELGGKNTAVVLDDAPLEKAAYDVLYSALATAGQRCTAVSRVVVERGVAARFVDLLVRHAPGFTCGKPSQEGVFHGPLATQAGLEKFQRFQRVAEDEGHATLLASRALAGGHYATGAIHLVERPRPGSAYEHEEIFGPDLAVYVADDLEAACARAEATPYGLTASVFTASEARFEACAARLRVGCLGWNAPTVGSSSRLPFGGVKHSGNHRPAGLFSTTYCAYPVAVQRGSTALDVARLAPGVTWRG